MKKILTLALLLFCLGAFAQEKIALVIGNADYQISALKNALNDAEDIASALKKLDFKVTLVKNANKRVMKDAIYDFSEKLNKDTVGLFYYAGHAVQYHGENYLIPINALSEIKKNRHLEDEAVRSGIVSKEMELSQSKLNFIFLDACRDNPLPSESRGVSNGLARSQDAEGSLIAFSTSPGNTAKDGEGRNSPYTKNLLKFINTPNQPIELMLKDVKEAVANETNGNQLPWYESSITGNFCFNSTPEGCAKFNKIIIYDLYLKGINDIETIEFLNGNNYVGQVKDNLMHGKGVLTETSGIKYKGEFLNGLKHGNGGIIFLNGNTYEGSFFENQKDGVGLSTFINGAIVKSRWDKGERVFIDEDNFFDGSLDEWGLPSGYGTFFSGIGNAIEATWELGNITSETTTITLPSGDIFKGLSPSLSGTGIFINSIGEMLEGNFHYGLLNGKGKKTWANGDVYIGEFKDGYLHGQGKKMLNHGQVRSGEFKFNKLNGQGIQIFIDGSIYKGEWLNGLAHGFGTFDVRGENGFKYQGDWKFDYRTGKGTQVGNSGYIYEGEFLDGDFSGYADKYYHPSDNLNYVGEMKNNLFNGVGKLTYLDDGSYYEGEFFDDWPHGNGVYSWPDGQKYKGEFFESVFNGNGVMFYPNGEKYAGEFKDDLKHGSGIYTWPNGNSYNGQWKEGFFHGKGVVINADGSEFSGNFINDLEHGKAIFTDADKSIFNEIWEKGILISSVKKTN